MICHWWLCIGGIDLFNNMVCRKMNNGGLIVDRGLKQLIDGNAQMIEDILDGHVENGAGIAKLLMAEFAMYLSASDGTIQWEEARMIAEYFDLPMNQNSVADFIREHNIYSTEFESTVPIIFTILVQTDNILYQNGAFEDPKSRAGSEILFETYQAIARELINCDGDEAANEVADANIFLEMLDRYLDENLLTRRASVSGFDGGRDC